MKPWMLAAPVILVGALVMVFAIGLQLDPTKVPSPLIDRAAPEFELPRLDASDQLFSSELLKGQVSIVNVWASWCVPCRLEHPLWVQWAQVSDVPVFGLNYKDDPLDARAWLERYGDPYALIASDLDGRVGIDWGVYGVPETFVVDANGRIRYKHIGPLDARVMNEQFRPAVERVLAEVAS